MALIGGRRQRVARTAAHDHCPTLQHYSIFAFKDVEYTATWTQKNFMVIKNT